MIIDANGPRVAPMRAPTDPATLLVETPDQDECWRLLASVAFGRLAVRGLDGSPDIFPMNFLIHQGDLVLRSGPGSKMRAIVVDPRAAFEVDGHDSGFFWSVVVRGEATRMSSDVEIETSGVLRLVSSSPTEKFNYIRLTPGIVSGRRFPERPASS